MSRFSARSIEEIAEAITGRRAGLDAFATAAAAEFGESALMTQAEGEPLELDIAAAPATRAPQTVLVAAATSPALPLTYLSGASRAYAATLAAPAASMIGRIKLIEYTVGVAVVTLNAANIDDESELGPT